MGDVNLRKMPEELMRRVKAAAALRGITMRQYAIEAFEKALKEEKKHGGPAGRK